MKNIILIVLVSLFTLNTLSAYDFGVGHVGHRRNSKIKRIEESQLKPKTTEADYKKSDEYYAAEYKKTLLTKEEREFAEKHRIPLTATERIKKEYAENISIVKVERPIDKCSVAWKFVAIGRDIPANHLGRKTCSVEYFIPNGESVITDDNIGFKFVHGHEFSEQIYYSSSFKIQGKESIVAFSKGMFKIVKKMEEWIEVAKKNNIRDFSKEYEEFEFSFTKSNGVSTKLKARFKVVEQKGNVCYITELFHTYSFSPSEYVAEFDLIALKNFAVTTQIDKAIIALNKKIEQMESHQEKEEKIDNLFK